MELPDVSSKKSTKDLCTWHSMIHGSGNLTLIVEVATEMIFVITQIETQTSKIMAKTTCFGILKCSSSIFLCIILAVQKLPC